MLCYVCKQSTDVEELVCDEQQKNQFPKVFKLLVGKTRAFVAKQATQCSVKVRNTAVFFLVQSRIELKPA